MTTEMLNTRLVWKKVKHLKAGITFLRAKDPHDRYDCDEDGNEWTIHYCIYQGNDGAFDVYEGDGENGNFLFATRSLDDAKAKMQARVDDYGRKLNG